MNGRAHLLTKTRNTPEEDGVGGVHRSGKRIKSRFSRQDKPTDHLGGLDTEQRIPIRVDLVKFNTPLCNQDRDINIWPRAGSSHEDMEVSIG